jgi:hypothetical protein
MAIFTNPTGSPIATAGNDTIIFNSALAMSTTTIDALSGIDTLTMQVPTRRDRFRCFR